MNKQDAILFARVSSWAYYGMNEKSNQFKLLAKFENKGTDTQGLFGEANDNTFVVAFRGSEETGIADWITDLKIAQQVFPYDESGNKKVKVHFGFIQAYKSVRESVLKAAKETPHKRIVCTGHSLGAALATLCALDIKFNLPDKDVDCYTYGSPKVGNKDFVDSYNKRVPNTYRFVNGKDAVPQIPPVAYDHVGELHHLTRQQAESKAAVVEDHFPANYVQTLRDTLKA